MCLTAVYVVAFANDLAVVYNDCAHHGVGGCGADAVLCYLNATSHVFFFFHSFLLFLDFFYFCSLNLVFMIVTARQIRQVLQQQYAAGEAAALSRIVCCEILGQAVVDYYVGKDITLSSKQAQELDVIMDRLLKI